MKKISLIALISFIIDRIIKIAVDKLLKPFIKYNVIRNFLYLLNCRNEGAAFNIFEGATLFLIFITVVALYLIIRFIKTEKLDSNLNISYGLLIGGILGNLFDRIVYGSVIDYIGISFFNYNFPIFNLADMLIVLGAIFIIINEFRGDKNEKSNS